MSDCEVDIVVKVRITSRKGRDVSAEKATKAAQSALRNALYLHSHIINVQAWQPLSAPAHEDVEARILVIGDGSEISYE